MVKMATTKTGSGLAPQPARPAVRPLPQDQERRPGAPTKRPPALKKRLARALPMLVASGVLVVLVVVVAVMDLRNPIGYTAFMTQGISYEKAKVTAVVDQGLQPAPGMPGWQLGTQKIAVRFKNGPMKGRQVTLVNELSTTHNIRVGPGQSVIVKAERPAGEAPYYTLYDYDRTPGLIAVAAIFAALMLAVGGLKGLRSLLGLCISLYFIFAFLLPAIYRGYSPVLMSFVTVIIIAVFSLLLLKGFSRKTLTAVAATGIGVALAALCFLLVSAIVHLVGYNITEAEDLIVVSQRTGLQLGQVLFAAVLISSLGAVMDITVSIAAALYEMKEVRPELSPRELLRSGAVIGRDMIGGMCQTLILAFVGSSLATLLVIVSYGTRFDQFMSSDYVAVEVAQGIAGSMAVVLAVPVTAALCALLAGRLRDPAPAVARHQARNEVTPA